MRGFKWLLVVCAIFLLPVGAAQAAFDNSHHDMRSYLQSATLVSGCAPCHGLVTTSVATAIDNQVGTVGALCLARCHLGGAGTLLGVNPQLTPTTGYGLATATTDYTVSTVGNINITYFDTAHGRNPANLTNPSFAAAPAAIATWPTTATSTWPYMAAATNMQCTSCHAVHDNKNAPFLWSPLAPTAANGTDGFCDKCHSESGRRGDITAPVGGNHPINVVLDNTAAAGRNTNGRRGRRIIIQDYGTGTTGVFDTATSAPSTLVNQTSPLTAWNSGGHVVSFGTQAAQQTTAITAWAPATTSQVLGCFTCHAAHRPPGVAGEDRLVVVPTVNVANTWNPLCVGCHGPNTSFAGDQREFIVGSLTNYGHPVGDNTGTPYTASVGQFTFAVNFNTAMYTARFPQNNTGPGAGGQVLCTSCHKVHGGTGMALVNIGQAAGTGTGAICKACHNGTGIVNQVDTSKGGTVTTGHNAANSHHVTRSTAITGINATGVSVAASNGEGGNNLFIKQPSWSSTGGVGDISASMDCADCHIFNKTAHNW